MPFESKDIRAVYDSLTVDPLFNNLNKPVEEFILSEPKIDGFTAQEIEFYKESRRKRLEEMYSKSK